jgi:shikimate dehydrogenase
VIGWPVSHSLSPAIHNAAFEAMGLDWVYTGLPVEPGRLPQALAGLGALGFSGVNVTMPHKTESASLATDLSEDAERLGSVNTFLVDDDGLHGHNTDAPGFERFLRKDAAFEPAGREVLIFGAGGAARAVSLAVVRAGASAVVVAVRDPASAAPLLEALDGSAARLRVIPMAGATTTRPDLLVNATPLGARGEDLPLPASLHGMTVVDLLYHPSVTPLQTRAQADGAAAFGGLGLLLHQAALSSELWTGTAPPLDVMSAAALAELADRER